MQIFIVNLWPSPAIFSLGSNASLICTRGVSGNEHINQISWRINRTSVPFNQDNITTDFGNDIGTLTFGFLMTKYNNSKIQCRAEYTTRSEVSEMVLLQVQGI